MELANFLHLISKTPSGETWKLELMDIVWEDICLNLKALDRDECIGVARGCMCPQGKVIFLGEGLNSGEVVCTVSPLVSI